MKILSAVFMSLFLFGCASGTAFLSSPAREPIDAAQVKIYTEAPESYEVIGVVEAFSEAGLNIKQTQNYAEQELRKQAAKIGANGVILTSADEEQVSYSIPSRGLSGNVEVSSGSKTAIAVSGKAIYVPD